MGDVDTMAGLHSQGCGLLVGPLPRLRGRAGEGAISRAVFVSAPTLKLPPPALPRTRGREYTSALALAAKLG